MQIRIAHIPFGVPQSLVADVNGECNRAVLSFDMSETVHRISPLERGKATVGGGGG
jgi:hypothetical protein